MFAFVQPFGLSSPAGGPRILRSLLRDTRHPFVSISTSPVIQPPTTIGQEIHLPVRPSFGRLEQSRVGKVLGTVLPLYAPLFKKRLTQNFQDLGVKAVHSIPHGLEFSYVLEVAQQLGLPYYLNVHDELDYNLKGHVELPEANRQLAKAWQQADGRIVISDAMGRAYCERFGNQKYTVVTDGIEQLPMAPKVIPSKSLRVYFMGSVHLSYQENFRNLVLGLDQFSKEYPDWTVSFTIRGHLPFSLPSVNIPIEYLPWATEAEVAKDFDRIDLLYLPLPFGESYQSFSRYSLSTKMVTYLGSGVPILYHTPADSAAAQLLSQANAGIALTSLNPDLISQALYDPDRSLEAVVENAFSLAKSQFMLSDVQARFWNVLLKQSAKDQSQEAELISTIN